MRSWENFMQISIELSEYFKLIPGTKLYHDTVLCKWFYITLFVIISCFQFYFSTFHGFYLQSNSHYWYRHDDILCAIDYRSTAYRSFEVEGLGSHRILGPLNFIQFLLFSKWIGIVTAPSEVPTYFTLQ